MGKLVLVNRRPHNPGSFTDQVSYVTLSGVAFPCRLHMALTNPSEIARETLKQLSARRLAPTPDNYRALFDEIGSPPPRHS